MKRNRINVKLCSSHQHPITKKEMKLIKKRILELEMQDKRSRILKLAEKCAEKFKNETFEKGYNKLSKYCNTKLKKLLKTDSIPTQDETKKIHDILKVYDQMFYNKPEN